MDLSQAFCINMLNKFSFDTFALSEPSAWRCSSSLADTTNIANEPRICVTLVSTEVEDTLVKSLVLDLLDLATLTMVNTHLCVSLTCWSSNLQLQNSL